MYATPRREKLEEEGVLYNLQHELATRSMYLSREYRLILNIQDELQGIVVAPATTSADLELGEAELTSVWKGIIFIRARDSPWFKGAFPFTITFPAGYPANCPICVFDFPLRSHPLLLNGVEVDFKAEYVSLRFNHVSVFVRLLKFLRRLFSAAGTANLEIDRVQAAADVNQSSIAQVDRNSPYFRFLTEEMLTLLLERYQERKKWEEERDRAGGQEGELGKKPETGSFESWFGSMFARFLPKARMVGMRRN